MAKDNTGVGRNVIQNRNTSKPFAGIYQRLFLQKSAVFLQSVLSNPDTFIPDHVFG
jgi:hypothetical protein